DVSLVDVVLGLRDSQQFDKPTCRVRWIKARDRKLDLQSLSITRLSKLVLRVELPFLFKQEICHSLASRNGFDSWGQKTVHVLGANLDVGLVPEEVVARR